MLSYRVLSEVMGLEVMGLKQAAAGAALGPGLAGPRRGHSRPPRPPGRRWLWRGRALLLGSVLAVCLQFNSYTYPTTCAVRTRSTRRRTGRRRLRLCWRPHGLQEARRPVLGDAPAQLKVPDGHGPRERCAIIHIRLFFSHNDVLPPKQPRNLGELCFDKKLGRHV